MEGRIPVLLIDTLRKRSPNVGHFICCNVINPENMEGLEGMKHQRLYFVVQATALDCSRGVAVDQFGDDML